MSGVKRYAKRLTLAQIELAQPRTEFVLAADYDALEAECNQARRTAEYWKAEHLAGNQVLDAALKQVEGLRELLETIKRHNLSDCMTMPMREAIDAALSAKP